MASRHHLQTLLEELLESKNVYYQPPSSKKMEYDAIRYSLKQKKGIYASDARYANMNCYELIVISRLPDHPVIDKLLSLPYCSYDRHYLADNLNHDVLTLYF